MPKNKFQEVIFTIIMVFVMVYAMICYNIVPPCTCNLSSIRSIYVSVHELCSNSADQTCTGKPVHPDMASDNSNELPDGILLADLLRRSVCKIRIRKTLPGEGKSSSFC